MLLNRRLMKPLSLLTVAGRSASAGAAGGASVRCGAGEAGAILRTAGCSMRGWVFSTAG